MKKLVAWILAGLLLFEISGGLGGGAPVAAQDVGTPLAVDATVTLAAEVQQMLASLQPDEMTTVIVKLRTRADLSGIRDRLRRVRLRRIIQALRNHADTSQRGLRQLLRTRRAEGKVGDVQYYWVFNGLMLTATPAVIAEVAALPAVQTVTPNASLFIPATARFQSGVLPESNLVSINAPALWDLGWRGQGIVIANFDTGVDVSHPNLASKWRGGANSWFDPSGQHATPVDMAGASSGHGTWTMGVMVGGAAGGTTVGVAPDAQWIAAKIFNDQGAATVAGIHAAFQWVLDPDGDPLTDDAPHVVNHSWTFQTPGCNLEFQTDLQVLHVAGILPIFAAGNAGPGAQTSVSPSNNPEAFAVGAVDNNGQIYAYSSRGPSACGETETIFPEIVAPGVNILSTDLYGLYTNATGTSLAAPHVTGALALLLNAYPDLTTAEQETALRNSVVDLGPVGPDNDFGHGRLDIWAAYQSLATTPSNQLPAVDSGPDQTITWPNLANLDGTVSDDGLPNPPSLVSTTWSQTSGPGVATFANANAVDTAASFSAAGFYVLRLTADDSALSSFDEVTIVVNQPPSVDAGLDQTITLPTSATLNGIAADDGFPLPTNLIVSWSQTSGPGITTFADPNVAATTANFSQAGVYTLRLTASDGVLTSNDDIVITVNPANQPPEVNAGVDQTLALLAPATLDGTVIDDGLPAPPTLSTVWSQTSGPGVTTFANASVVDTTASFSMAGVYVLRLTANDGAVATFDEVTIVINQPPSVNAGVDQTITLPATAVLDGAVSDDGLPTPPTLTTVWSQTSGPGVATFANASAVDTTASFAVAGTYVLRLTASDGVLTTVDEVTVIVNAAPPSATNTLIYVSSSSNGTVGGVVFQDEDILAFNPTNNSWLLVYDGSLVGVGGVDVDGFNFQPDGSLLLSFDNAVSTLAGLTGGADDSDIVRFTPTTAGNYTAGTYSLFFDASDVGLTTNDEDIDAFGFTPDGRLLVSTLGNVSAPAASGTLAAADEDLLLFTGTLGASASGVWQLYFDGSVFGLTATDEDIWGAVPENGKLYLTTAGNFSVSGASGTGADIFACTATPATLNTPITGCTFAPFWTGATYGFGGKIVDGLDMAPAVVVVINQAPAVNAGVDQTITLPATAALDGTVSDDGLPTPPTLTTTWSRTSGPGTVTFANASAVDTTASFAVAGTYGLRLTVSDGVLTTVDEVTVIVNAAPPSATNTLIYVSSSSNGTVGGVVFQDEDILGFNPLTNGWLLVYDGSLVGVGGVDVDGFNFQPDGSLLLSFDAAVGTLTGLTGGADDSDIVRFTPTIAGNYTAGTYSLFFDASDVGLDASDEDIDAFGFTPDGRLLVSTLGNVSAPAASGTLSAADEDLLLFTGTLGASASGVWQLYFDGSVFGLTATDEDIWGIAAENGKLYLTTAGNFSVSGASGTGADIFACAATPATLNAPITGCTFAPFWTGATYGFGGKIVDGLDIGPVVSAGVVAGGNLQNTVTAAEVSAVYDDPTNGDIRDPDGEGFTQTIFLPLITTVIVIDDDPTNGNPHDSDVDSVEDETRKEDAAIQVIFLPLINR